MASTDLIDRRFERLGRLVSEGGVRALNRSHVIVCGMGGVGSWAAEALARSGIGHLTLIDFDQVSLSTLNRQLPGLETTLGQAKVDVIAARVKMINPRILVTALTQKIEPDSLATLIDPTANYLIDAIDQLGNKCALLAFCTRRGLSVVTSTGAGGRLDPTRVRVDDLSLTEVDPLAKMVRVYLRTKHGFPAQGPFGVAAVYSTESPRPSLLPSDPRAERGRAELIGAPTNRTDPLTSGMRNVIMGTACFVTSVFGMVCASVVVNGLLAKEHQRPRH